MAIHDHPHTGEATTGRYALSKRKSKLPANLYRLSAADSDVGEKDIIDDRSLRLLCQDPLSYERGYSESDHPGEVVRGGP